MDLPQSLQRVGISGSKSYRSVCPGGYALPVYYISDALIRHKKIASAQCCHPERNNENEGMSCSEQNRRVFAVAFALLRFSPIGLKKSKNHTAWFVFSLAEHKDFINQALLFRAASQIAPANEKTGLRLR